MPRQVSHVMPLCLQIVHCALRRGEIVGPLEALPVRQEAAEDRGDIWIRNAALRAYLRDVHEHVGKALTAQEAHALEIMVGVLRQ
jgi:hypothetical protein